MLSQPSLKNVEQQVRIGGELCAILLPASFDKPGIQFFTPNELSQQLASMSYSPGKIIPAHTHNPVRREVPIPRRRCLFERVRFESISSRCNESIKPAVYLVRET